MPEKERLKRLSDGFNQLSDESKDFILEISRALVFAKDTLSVPPGGAANLEKSK